MNSKKMILNKFCLLVLLMIAAATSVFAQGQERGNGTDDTDSSERNAWLVGQPVGVFKYCLKIAPGFQYNSSQFKARLDHSLEVWSAYFQKTGVISSLIEKGYSVPLTSATEVSCSSAHDMTFYLGAEDNVTNIVKKQYRNPTAFTFRTEFEVGKTGKGLIWFAMPGSVYPDRKKTNEKIAFPNWIENETVFEMFLIHELGHAYGISHVAGTIMDESLASLVSQKGLVSLNIELDRELISYYPKNDVMKLMAFEVEGTEVPILPFPGNYKYKGAIFNATIEKNRFYHGFLEVELANGKKEIPINVNFDLKSDMNNVRSEKIVCFSKETQNGDKSLCFSNSIVSMIGMASDDHGNLYPAVLEYNYSRSLKDINESEFPPYVLKIFKNGNWEIYFKATRIIM